MKLIRLAMGFIAALFLLTGCASGASSKPVPASSGVNTGGSLRTKKGGDELENAIRELSDYLNKRIPEGNKAVFLYVKSDWPDLSGFILDGLTENAVNDDVFTVVDRQQLDAIRSELNFQWSGEVSDSSAQEIGQMLGAQTIVSGSITTIGSIYRIQIRAIAVQTATLQGQFSQSVDSKGNTVAALSKRIVPASAGGAAVSGSSAAASGSQTSAKTQTAQTPAPAASGAARQTTPPTPAPIIVPPSTPPVPVVQPTTPVTPVVVQPKPAAPIVVQPQTPVPAAPSVSQTSVQPVGQTQPGLYTGDAYIPTQPNTPSPQPRISGDRAGLYVNGAYQGNMDLLDSIDWIKLNARSGGNYTIVLGKDEAVPYIMLNFNNLQLSITLKGSGAERRVRYDNNRPSYSMFVVGVGVTFILEDGITLTGLQSNSKSLVQVEGGNFTMNGGSITNSKVSNGNGGGVYVDSGTFTMNNGTINGNNASYGNYGGYGGGVFVLKGTFIMNNGTISGNSAMYSGGGVNVESGGTFTMVGGTISGNSAGIVGGGVCNSNSSIFTKSGTGGIIYGSNAPDGQANKASRSGHAVYSGSQSRDSTARVSQALDSRQRGAAGGWE